MALDPRARGGPRWLTDAIVPNGDGSRNGVQNPPFLSISRAPTMPESLSRSRFCLSLQKTDITLKVLSDVPNARRSLSTHKGRNWLRQFTINKVSDGAVTTSSPGHYNAQLVCCLCLSRSHNRTANTCCHLVVNLQVCFWLINFVSFQCGCLEHVLTDVWPSSYKSQHRGFPGTPLVWLRELLWEVSSSGCCSGRLFLRATVSGVIYLWQWSCL